MQTGRAPTGRRACVCTAQATWGTINGSTRTKACPPFSYSVNRRDITGAELGLLLASAHSEDMVQGVPLSRQNFSYWTSQQGLRHAAKLELALRRSVATVACFTTWDVYDDTAAYGADSDDAPSGALHPPQQLAQEEECALTAQQHGLWQREDRRGGGWGESGRGPWGGHHDPSGIAQELQQQQQPESDAFSSSSSLFSASCSTSYPSSSGRHGTPSMTSPKPSTKPMGVPDMDWNWMLPADASRSSSGSGASASHGASGGSGGGGGGRSNGSGEATSRPVGTQAYRSPSSASSASSHSPSSSWSLLSSSPLSSGGRDTGRKSLVGFARATGDSSLVATIYDVAVHPAVRGLGIGRRLVKLLIQQIQARTVYDIGAVGPTSGVGFWDRCSFEDDREGSTFMMFMGRRDGGDVDWAPATSEDLLDHSSLGFWDAAQQSPSLQALLQQKLLQMRDGDPGTGGGGQLLGGTGRGGEAGQGRDRRGGASGMGAGGGSRWRGLAGPLRSEGRGVEDGMYDI